MNVASRIALGTAQFGLDYGVTNATGRIAEQTTAAVLARARELGIVWLDTAAAYGSAEAVLGRLAGTDPGWRICTKAASASDGADLVAHARRQFGFKPGDFPAAEAYYSQAISLPMYATLTETQQDFVVEQLLRLTAA